MKIRGIRLDKLLKSGLFPALKSLIGSWNKKHGTAIENSCNALVVGNHVSLFLLVVAFVTQSKSDMLFGGIVISIIFLITLPARLRVRKFTKTIAELDSIIKEGPFKNGIFELNKGIVSIFEETLRILVREAVKLQAEKEPMDPEIEAKGHELRRFDSLIKSLGYDLGSFKPYFDEEEELYETLAHRPSVPV